MEIRRGGSVRGPAFGARGVRREERDQAEIVSGDRARRGDLGLSRSRGQEAGGAGLRIDRKSTRLNSSHITISYAVFCLKKKNKSICPFVYNELARLAGDRSPLPATTTS